MPIKEYFLIQKRLQWASIFFGFHTHIELELARNMDRTLYDGKNTWEPTSDRLRLTDESMMSLAAQYSF